MTYSIPRLVKDQQNKYSIVFYVDGKRFRVSNGKKFGMQLSPNNLALTDREHAAEELRLCISIALKKGWGQRSNAQSTLLSSIQGRGNMPESKETYRRSFASTMNRLEAFVLESKLSNLPLENITTELCYQFLNSRVQTASSFNRERKHLSSFLNSIVRPIGLSNPVEPIPIKREVQSLHKPFNDVHAVLEDIRAFNEKLFLCCLLTYGCLLRPHQEIRQLTWSDFSDDLEFISLSGKRNKSGRNRIVPVSPYIRKHLRPGRRTDNIFTATEEPFNACYFKTLWSRYKKQSKILEANQTLYSFRHTGAIEVYKKTKDIAVVQQVMGHASMQVTLGYLRNLEVPVLRVEDMPV